MGRVCAAFVVVFVAGAGIAQAQAPPDLTGLWISQAADISVLVRAEDEISLTPFGADRYRKLDMANSPSYKCLPYGPTRGLQSTNPFQIVQTRDLIAVITEHIDPRGKAYFWIGEEYFNSDSVEGTDYHAVKSGYVSVTPLRSDMTDHQALTAIETWNYLKDSELLQKS